MGRDVKRRINDILGVADSVDHTSKAFDIFIMTSAIFKLRKTKHSKPDDSAGRVVLRGNLISSEVKNMKRIFGVMHMVFLAQKTRTSD